MHHWRIRCAKCKDPVGLWPPNLRDNDERLNVFPLTRCPGKGKHQKPTEKTVRIMLGLIEEFDLYYPETKTYERAYRYIGPRSLLLLLFGFIFLVRANPNTGIKMLRVSGKLFVWLPRRLKFWKRLRAAIKERSDGFTPQR